eukprot:2409766-Rhodomonas_salina.1
MGSRARDSALRCHICSTVVTQVRPTCIPVLIRPPAATMRPMTTMRPLLAMMRPLIVGVTVSVPLQASATAHPISDIPCIVCVHCAKTYVDEPDENNILKNR